MDGEWTGRKKYDGDMKVCAVERRYLATYVRMAQVIGKQSDGR